VGQQKRFLKKKKVQEVTHLVGAALFEFVWEGGKKDHLC